MNPVRGRSDDGTQYMAVGARTVDEDRLEWSVLTTSPLMSSGAAAALLFQVESIPVLGGQISAVDRGQGSEG